jgi:hypothetical protein
VVTTHESQAIYFENVGKLDLMRDGGWHVAAVSDKGGRSLMRVYTREEVKAKRFLDAIRVMK